jgi:hypothetical protein
MLEKTIFFCMITLNILSVFCMENFEKVNKQELIELLASYKQHVPFILFNMVFASRQQLYTLQAENKRDILVDFDPLAQLVNVRGK